jgi:adenylosuccinate synthase
VERAVLANAPTQIALHGADYIDHANYSTTDWSNLTSSAREFVDIIEGRLDVPVTFVGTGPTNHHIIDRRAGVRSSDGVAAVYTPVGLGSEPESYAVETLV